MLFYINNIKKYFLIITGFVIIPVFSLYAESSGFELVRSNFNEAVQYQLFRVYATIQNNTPKDFEGIATLSCEKGIFGSSQVITLAKNGDTDTVFFDDTSNISGNISCSVEMRDQDRKVVSNYQLIDNNHVKVLRDLDHDGLPDLRDNDIDGDGLSNEREIFIGADPEKSDTDGDGFTDKEDPFPTDAKYTTDSDNDGIADEIDTDNDNDNVSDIDEEKYGSNPLKSDTDGDGLSDYTEIITYKTNPLKIDTDNDGIADKIELDQSTNPHVADTDGDGIPDNLDVLPTSTKNLDSDKDSIPDTDEVRLGTDPKNPDTDGDGVIDGKDSFPLNEKYTKDTDGDSIPDSVDTHTTAPISTPAVIWTTSPDYRVQSFSPTDITEENTANIEMRNIAISQKDTDGDGLSDTVEIIKNATDPSIADTDADGINDGQEVLTEKTNPLKIDSDGDGIADKTDSYPTDSLNGNGDGDNDGVTDKTEARYRLNKNNPRTHMLPDRITVIIIKFKFIILIGIVLFILYAIKKYRDDRKYREQRIKEVRHALAQKKSISTTPNRQQKVRD